ncbi:transglutaminase-like putative cysteine protease [Bradyrhizobium sp. USDA 4369]
MNDIGESGRGGSTTVSGDEVRYAPVPAWVDLAAYATEPSPDQESAIANGVCRLLSDMQVDLTGPELCWSYRTAQRILTKEGAERASHIVIEFDPGYQRLEVHAVRIRRGDQYVDHARPGCFQVFRRERDIERLMLNGRLTASFLVPDVRANDVLEFSCSLYGETPILKGKYQSWVAFDGANPSFDYRHRLLKRRDRAIASREFNDPPPATISVTGEIEEICRRLRGQRKRGPSAPLTPSWVIEDPAFQLSEFEEWSDVAALMVAAYDSAEIPLTLADEIDRIGAAHPDPAQRAAEWLRFVQRELRYFFLALGEGGLVPRDLDAIWAGRFGDCKDKARLYVAGARRLGLEACAALVSTTHGRTLDRVLPSPAVFDHCIVRVRLDGKSYWLDPTLPLQGGGLDQIELPHLGWALPLAADASQLEKLPEQNVRHIVHCHDDWRIGPSRQSPASLHRSLEFSAWGADHIRNLIANEGEAGFSQALLRQLQASWPAAAESEAIAIQDDQVQNKIIVDARYTISDCWRASDKPDKIQLQFIESNISSDLSGAGLAAREHDIYVGRPRRLSWLLHVELPRAWPRTKADETHALPGLQLISRYGVDGRHVDSFKELTVETWTLPRAKAEDYDLVVKCAQQNILSIQASAKHDKVRAPGFRSNLNLNISVYFAFLVLWFAYNVLRTLLTSGRH